MSALKKLITRLARIVMWPARLLYHRQNGTTPTEPRHEIPNDVLLGLVREKLAEGHSTIIWVKGYSMRPFIEYGRDRVKLVPVDTLSVGDAVLAELEPGHYVLHRIIRIEGEHVTLQGDGNLSGTEHCQRQDVCGVVEEYIRPRRTLLASDPALKRRIRLWYRLRPIRRILLYIYKSFV